MFILENYVNLHYNVISQKVYKFSIIYFVESRLIKGGGKKMSYFAKTRCPKCGLIKSHWLDGLGFYGEETTKCSCGYEYINISNCINQMLDDDEKTTPINRLAGFSTEEIEKEIERRKT